MVIFSFRQTDRQTDRQTETDRQTDRDREKEAEKKDRVGDKVKFRQICQKKNKRSKEYIQNGKMNENIINWTRQMCACV